MQVFDGVYDFGTTAAITQVPAANAARLGASGRLRSIMLQNMASYTPLWAVCIFLSHDQDPAHVVSNYAQLAEGDVGSGDTPIYWSGDIPVNATDTITVQYFATTAGSRWRLNWRIERA